MKKKKVKITKDQSLGEIIRLDPENGIILLGFGMHCSGCPLNQTETLEQACMAHCIDVDYVLERLNEEA